MKIYENYVKKEVKEEIIDEVVVKEESMYKKELIINQIKSKKKQVFKILLLYVYLWFSFSDLCSSPRPW